MIKKILRNSSGKSFPDVCVMIISVMLLLVLLLNVVSVFVTKHNLDVFATQLCRTAEINGCVGTATSVKTEKLKKQTGLNPSIRWSKTGNVQINQEFSLELSIVHNIGLFGRFGSFPIKLISKVSGTSEVYHK